MQGVDPMEATRRIKAAQVDYSSLTNIEREWFRRIIPFWSFNSRMGAYITKKIWDKPGGAFTQLGLRLPQEIAESAQSDDNQYVPKEIKESYGMGLENMRNTPGLGPLIDMIAPKAEGKNAYLKDVDLPGVDLINLIKPQRDATGTIAPIGTAYETLLNSAGSLAHPFIRTGVEQLSGRSLWNDQALTQYEPTLQKLGRKAGITPLSGADDAMKWIASGVDYIPHAPRVLQFANRMLDTERTPELSARILQGIVDASSGVKIRNILDDAAALDTRREVDAMLDASPMMRSFESKYIPEELLPYASPEEQLLYQLSRELSRDARKAKEGRNRANSIYANPYY
jgi:hypothetical protein